VKLIADVGSADRTKKAIEEDGGECLCLALDLMKEENVKKVVDEHMKKYGALDILVNNASKQMMCEDIADIKVSSTAGQGSSFS
jgi:NADP-dependent 3-hydroxy acid dehydrogenase YdfG